MTGDRDDQTQEHRVPPWPPADEPVGWPGEPPLAQPTDFDTSAPSQVTPTGWPGSEAQAASPPWLGPATTTLPPAQPGRRQPLSYYHTSGFVALGAIVLLLFGLLFTFVGIAGLIISSQFVDWVREGASAINVPALSKQLLSESVTIAAVIVLVVGLLHQLSAVGALAHRNWARWLGATLALLGTLLAALGLYGAISVDPAVASVPTEALAIVVAVLMLYAYSLLVLVFGGGHFVRFYRGR